MVCEKLAAGGEVATCGFMGSLHMLVHPEAHVSELLAQCR